MVYWWENQIFGQTSRALNSNPSSICLLKLCIPIIKDIIPISAWRNSFPKKKDSANDCSFNGWTNYRKYQIKNRIHTSFSELNLHGINEYSWSFCNVMSQTSHASFMPHFIYKYYKKTISKSLVGLSVFYLPLAFIYSLLNTSLTNKNINLHQPSDH